MLLTVFYKKIKILTWDDLSDWIHNKGITAFDFIIKVLIALIIYIIISKILKKIINVIQGRLDKKGIDQIASRFILNLIKYAVLVFVLVTIITQLNIVEVTSIAALVASAGVGISLAMQGALSNFAGGILLLMIKPFKKGDYIIVTSANVEGVVELIEIYYTTIRSIYGETIKIPNSQLTNNSVINRHGNNKRALIINVHVAYGTDIEKAKMVLTDILDKSITNDLPKNVFVDDMEDSGIKLGTFAMVPVADYLKIKRDINEQILTEFKKADIEIPYNQLDVHIIDQNS